MGPLTVSLSFVENVCDWSHTHVRMYVCMSTAAQQQLTICQYMCSHWHTTCTITSRKQLLTV